MAADKVAFKVESKVKECPDDKLKKLGLNNLSFMELGMSTDDGLNQIINSSDHDFNTNNLDLDNLNLGKNNIKDIDGIDDIGNMNVDTQINKLNKKSIDNININDNTNEIGNLSDASDPLDQAEELLSTKNLNANNQLNNNLINQLNNNSFKNDELNKIGNLRDNTLNNLNLDNSSTLINNINTDQNLPKINTNNQSSNIDSLMNSNSNPDDDSNPSLND